MQTEYIFRFDDEQQKINYPLLKWAHESSTPGFGVYQSPSRGDLLTLAKKFITLNDEGLILLRKTPAQFNPLADVIQFHEKFELGYKGPPRILPPEIWKLRLKQHTEENQELLDAKTMADRFDACLDHMYFNLGTMYLHGWDVAEGWRRVHAKNMEKIRAASASDSKRGSAFDVVKPPGWTPPDLSSLVVEDTNLPPPDNNLPDFKITGGSK